MAEEAATQEDQQTEELLTLSEVSNRTGISMPTLQRYKRNHQDRIPSEGKGRRQRYPVEALQVFEDLKAENLRKRGRPKGSTNKPKSGRGRKARKAASNGNDGLLTLTEVAERTGISYPTLVRYVKLHADRIPFEGEGRRRRYHPEAVDVFREIRSESPRGRRAGSGSSKSSSQGSTRSARSGGGDNSALVRRLDKLERSQQQLVKEIRGLVKHLQKPVKVTVNR